jgi:hypothetical protein
MVGKMQGAERKIMKNVLVVVILCVTVCIPLFAQEEYTLFYRGDVQGTVTIRQDRNGKITITPRLTKVNSVEFLDNSLCPLIPILPEWLDNPVVNNTMNRLSVNASNGIITVEGNTRAVTYSDGSGGRMVIQGNTATETRSNSSWWKKTVVEGNTVTETYSNGQWNKTVIDGGTTIITYSSGSWYKWVVNGNTTIHTNSYNERFTTVVDGNTTTETDKNGNWERWVDEDGTRTTTYSDGRWNRTVVERQGYNIFITKESGKK